MKKIISWSIISSIIIAIAVWVASIIFTFSYSEWSFFIGLALSVIIFFFNSSSGGAFSKGAALETSEFEWKNQKEKNEMRANLGVVFYGSVLYTIISLIVIITLY
ncbi:MULTISPECIES: hypothetical protein [Virgibacillus]|uniref:DUF3899 domain-containing protein n=2 Tax=Virgibacillus TaxID=84406 RepID=A0A024QBS6_9BACI|nr:MULTISPECIES: hypothetical protein [Virgibacillus]EQB36254.1 hypothetical protein M948_14565 [Virgibacillus sp. CM-4]GGJ45454.1 hypothetical protein GCM10007111_04340 [Virgibacillus kapii]CDQ39944.1 hypothetical protein BN990_02261 [Virgibacillus massiliensis]